MLSNLARIARRTLLKNKAGTVINLLGLTLGASACLAIFLIAHFECSTDRFHADFQRIYRIVGAVKPPNGDEEGKMGFVPYALPQAVRAEISGLAQTAAFISYEAKVKIAQDGRPDKVFEQRNMQTDPAELILTEPEYFTIFQYEWLAGNPRDALAAPFKVVISEKKAHKYFAGLSPEDCIGRTIIYGDSLRMSVSGVVRDWAGTSDLAFTDFLSFASINSSFFTHINLKEWDDVWSASQAFVKLDENVQPEQIEAQFPAFAKAHFLGQFKFTPHLQPFSKLHFEAEYADNYSRKAHLPTLYGLMAIAAFILLLAATNYINLSTAQSLQRSKEVGIRKTLGSSRRDLIRQFLTETLILTAAAVLLSLWVVPWAFSLFSAYLPQGLRFEINGSVLIFLALVIFSTALLAGLYPAFVLSSFLPARSLRGIGWQKGKQNGSLRKSLIVFQFAVSVVFILGALLVNRQIAFMRDKDLGFQSKAVMTLQAPGGRESVKGLSVLYPKIQQLAGVEKATMQIFDPMGQNFGLDRIQYKGQSEKTIDAAYKMGDENFIPFYEMKLLAGRNVMKTEGAREMVVTENFAPLLGFQKPEELIGQMLYWHEKAYPIVGVVANFHQQSLHESIPPTFITTSQNCRNIALKLRDQSPVALKATITALESLWATVYPDQKMQYTFLDDEIAKFYEKERKTSGLVNLATFIAVFISCLGLYALSVFAAEHQKREIGIRKVLGASVAGVTVLLTKDFLKLVVAAILIASPIAYYFMQHWLSDFAYRIELEWWMFTGAGAAAVLIAFLTVGFQSVKAALANPVQSLRSE